MSHRLRLEGALIGALTLAGVAFIVSTFLRPSGFVSDLLDTVLYNLVFLAAAAVLFAKVYRNNDSYRPWLYIACGLFLYGLGGLAWWVADRYQTASPVVGLHDWLWLAFYGFAFAGILTLSKDRITDQNSRLWLDAIMVGISGFAIIAAVIGPWFLTSVAQSDLAEDALNTLYLGGDVILVSLCLAMIQAFRLRAPAYWWLLVTGFSLFALADGTYLVKAATNTYTEGSWLDALWVLSAMAIGWACFLDHTGRVQVPSGPDLGRVTPALEALAGVALLVWGGGGRFSGIATTAALCALLIPVAKLRAGEGSAQMRKLRHLTLTNDTSRLSNERALRQDLDRWLFSTQQQQGLFDGHCDLLGVICLQVNGIGNRLIALGSRAADEVSQAIGETLRSALRECDNAYHLADDKFVILVQTQPTDHLAETAAYMSTLVNSRLHKLDASTTPLCVSECLVLAPSSNDPRAEIAKQFLSLQEAMARHDSVPSP